MSDALTPDENDAIREALANRRKLEAIKIYRESSGKGLKESKDFIEALIPGLQQQDPEKYAKLSNSGIGCGAKVLLMLSLAVLGFIGNSGPLCGAAPVGKVI